MKSKLNLYSKKVKIYSLRKPLIFHEIENFKELLEVIKFENNNLDEILKYEKILKNLNRKLINNEKQLMKYQKLIYDLKRGKK